MSHSDTVTTAAGLALPDPIAAGTGAFPCFGCRGEARYEPRRRRWSCRDGCGANGDYWELLARLGIPTGAPATTRRTDPVVGLAPGMTRGDLPAAISAADLVRKRFPEPRWAVPGVLPEGAALLAGAPKKGKSWLLLGIGVAIAAGGRALGSLPVAAGEVLYLALEDNERRLQERLLRVLDGASAPSRLHFFTRWPSLGDGGAEALDAWLTAHPGTRLVCVDVVARIRPPVAGSANLYQADYATMSALKTVADAHGVALVGVFHTRKAEADDPLDTINGTTGLAGAADTILVLTRERGRADAALYVRGRDVPEADHALSFDPVTCTWSLLGDAAEYRLTEERAAIVGALRDAGAELAPKEIADALGKKGEAVRYLLHKMAKAGEVVGVAGRYSLPLDTPNAPNTPNTAHDANTADRAKGARVGAGVRGGPVAANGHLRLVEGENGRPLGALGVLGGVPS